MSAIGAMTRWMQPCAVGDRIWGTYVMRRWDGVTCTLYVDRVVQIRGTVHVVTCNVEVK